MTVPVPPSSNGPEPCRRSSWSSTAHAVGDDLARELVVRVAVLREQRAALAAEAPPPAIAAGLLAC